MSISTLFATTLFAFGSVRAVGSLSTAHALLRKKNKTDVMVTETCKALEQEMLVDEKNDSASVCVAGTYATIICAASKQTGVRLGLVVFIRGGFCYRFPSAVFVQWRF